MASPLKRKHPVTRRSAAPLVLTALLVSVLAAGMHAQAPAAGEQRQEPAITFRRAERGPALPPAIDLLGEDAERDRRLDRDRDRHAHAVGCVGHRLRFP